MRCTSFDPFAAALASVSGAPSPSLQARKNVDRPDPAGLDHCPGRPLGEADRCTFGQEAVLPDRVRWFAMGIPVTNCDNGLDAPSITTEVESSVTREETWEHTTSAEIDLLGIKIGGESGWSTSQAQTASEKLTQLGTKLILLWNMKQKYVAWLSGEYSCYQICGI
ncbi:hypothetical protein PM082_014584 [Marasmius tenuissimus]|nr:hypothetical protein PM082_014584 [Marasmius tenuissimus]